MKIRKIFEIILGLLIPILLIFCILKYLDFDKELKDKRINKNPNYTVGTVINKIHNKVGKSIELKYIINGKSYLQEIAVSSTYFKQIEEGSTIAIKYNKLNPVEFNLVNDN